MKNNKKKIDKRDAVLIGSSLGLEKDTVFTGPADPPGTYWQEEDIVLSPMGGAFTGGRIAIAVHFIDLPPPALS